MFEKLIEGIKRYKNSQFDRDAYLGRIKALPRDYQIVYNGISDYMWASGADGTGVMEALLEVLAAFEDGARDSKDVFGITGENVIGFADGLLHELPGTTWMGKIKEDKNRSIVDAVKRMGGE
jgi:DNA-binding ferritin-like protein (Dps family)